MASPLRFVVRRWKRRILKIRGKIREKPVYGYIIAAVIFVIAGTVLFVTTRPPKYGPDMSLLWYHDLNTGESFSVKWDGYGEEHYHAHLPPQKAPSGPLKEKHGPLNQGDPAGVRVYKYACGDCSTGRFVGYYETFTVAIQKKIIAGTAAPQEIVLRQFWRLPDGDKWVIKDSPDGIALLDEIVKKCPGQRLAECNPRD